jgi:hypothetical protein
MKALTGIGLGLGVGDGDGVGSGVGDGDGDEDDVGVGLGLVGEGLGATRRNQRGRVTKTRSNFMRSSEGYITRAARVSTTRRLVRGSATLGRARVASGA